MGQITNATIKMIRDHIARGEHPPLTAHEIDQLATAWERGQHAASAEPDIIREALEVARNGLEWYRDRCPDAVDGSDDEADELIGCALASLDAAPVAQEPVARANIYMHKGRRQFLLTELGTKAAGDLGVGVHDLFASPVAAQAQPVVNQQMTTGAQDREDAAVLTSEFSKGYELGLRQRTSQDREDAERWRFIIRKVCAIGTAGSGYEFQVINLPRPLGNPMQGSVAQHFEEAIDAAREAKGADHG